MTDDEMVAELDARGYMTADIAGDPEAIARRYARHIGGIPRKRQRPPRVRTRSVPQPGGGKQPGQLVSPGGTVNWSQAPPGYDADLWSEAMYFRQGAEFHEDTVKEPLPVIYARIAEQINKDAKFPNVRPQKRMVLVHQMIRYFWNHWNEYEGIDNMNLGRTSLHVFTGYGNWIYTRDRVLQQDAERQLQLKIDAGETPFRQKAPVVRRERRRDPEQTEYEWKDPMRHGGPGGGIEKAREFLRRRDSERCEDAGIEGDQRTEG